LVGFYICPFPFKLWPILLTTLVVGQVSFRCWPSGRSSCAWREFGASNLKVRHYKNTGSPAWLSRNFLSVQVEKHRNLIIGTRSWDRLTKHNKNIGFIHKVQHWWSLTCRASVVWMTPWTTFFFSFFLVLA